MMLAIRVIERPNLLHILTDSWTLLQTLRRQTTSAINHAMQRACFLGKPQGLAQLT